METAINISECATFKGCGCPTGVKRKPPCTFIVYSVFNDANRSLLSIVYGPFCITYLTAPL